MKPIDIAFCLICVTLVSVGQVLLRSASKIGFGSPQLGIASWINLTSFVAVLIYGCAMIMWLWILSRVPITQAFAFFGLSFFLVPLLAHRFLGDPISINTWIGAIIILIGVLITSQQPI